MLMYRVSTTGSKPLCIGKNNDNKNKNTSQCDIAENTKKSTKKSTKRKDSRQSKASKDSKGKQSRRGRKKGKKRRFTDDRILNDIIEEEPRSRSRERREHSPMTRITVDRTVVIIC